MSDSMGHSMGKIGYLDVYTKVATMYKLRYLLTLVYYVHLPLWLEFSGELKTGWDTKRSCFLQFKIVYKIYLEQRLLTKYFT